MPVTEQTRLYPKGTPEGVTSCALLSKLKTLRPTTTRVTHDLVVEEDEKTDATSHRGGANAGTPAVPITFLNATHAEMHGTLGVATWNPPYCAVECDESARPGYATKKAHEYQEVPGVLQEKVAMLASLLKKSQACMAYTGAGISTSSGISDYATRATGSISKVGAAQVKSPFLARPTKAHRSLVSLYKQGLLKYWIQQNHDGLPQKAGFPQHLLNEIHGAWYDPSNPVVPMSGELRSDLFQDLLDWEQKTDLCISLGTSLCGMNADRVATTVAKRSQQGKAVGLVIIGLQQTQYDSICQLRIFAKLDDVFDLLSKELSLDVGEDKPYVPDVDRRDYENSLFEVPYAASGQRSGGRTTILDLREDSKVKLLMGPHAGAIGKVIKRDVEGHYDIRFDLLIKGKLRAPHQLKMGNWWVEALVKGQVPHMPLVSLK